MILNKLDDLRVLKSIPNSKSNQCFEVAGTSNVFLLPSIMIILDRQIEWMEHRAETYHRAKKT